MGNVDTNDKLWGLLGFFVPPAGLVLYLVWRQERPQDARYAKIGMVWGILVWGIAAIIRVYMFMRLFWPFIE